MTWLPAAVILFAVMGYEAEFARPRLATYLPPLYHDQSELVAVFLCADYQRKEWCGLEWDAIFDLIKKRQDDAIMLLRFDNTEIAGLYSTHGYVWIGSRLPEEIAALILERWRLISGQPTTAAPAAITSPPAAPTGPSAPLASAPSPALAVWKKKLEWLLVEEAKAADASAKFKIQEDIEEARAKIRELGG